VFWVAIAPGIDPIHPGIVLVVNMEIGIITPPVGLNLFVILRPGHPPRRPERRTWQA
jgi:TRAP-type C4-dicarboxylate transport system permease large subunit